MGEMSGAGPSTPARSWLKSSGLDTSNGTEFVQKRLAYFAKVLLGITLAFLLVSFGTGLLFRLPLELFVGHRANIAHMSGMALIAAVWLICRRGQLSLEWLSILDAAAVVGCCTAWAFFIDPGEPESVRSSVVAVIMTILARAILVPSTAARTARLSILATAPTVIMMLLFVRGALAAGTPSPFTWMTLIFQTLLLATLVAMATITSRTLYDLRRSVREANELGQYELEEKLGGGGMGEVWRARHRLLVRAAAIKLIRPELLAATRSDPDVVMRRFEREARATAALRSPHTVQLYDFGQAEDGTLFYVMELLSGIDLEQLVSRFGPVPAERAVHILKQVCHSLAEAHENGITHRDIKPANIVVSGVGTELDFAKVLDFGLVRLSPEQAPDGEMKLTKEGVLAGTPAYTAPEIALGDQTYDHRVDIYAVGCVGYWLLTGQLVFDSRTLMKMVVDHAQTAPPPPHTRTELPIPGDLEAVILSCLEKDPARRPPTAAALADRLSACALDGKWTRERAEAWWRLHMPRPAQTRPVADILLSREGVPARLRPRRDVARG
jgi:eukaryotic-like serine/threonine-protein kinase